MPTLRRHTSPRSPEETRCDSSPRFANETVNVSFDIWGGAEGKRELKDWAIEEVGLLNVLRRPPRPDPDLLAHEPPASPRDCE